MLDKVLWVVFGVYCFMENVMNDSLRDLIIMEDEIRVFNFILEDIFEIEKVIFFFVYVVC